MVSSTVDGVRLVTNSKLELIEKLFLINFPFSVCVGPNFGIVKIVWIPGLKQKRLF